MPQFADDLSEMSGRVKEAKPNAPADQIHNHINDRIRMAINYRIYWADLLTRAVIAIPAAYTTGTVTTVNGSKVVTGASTVWPVSDTVNANSSAALNEIGVQEVTPNSMTGIEIDTLLYVDALGTPEVVAVIETTSTTFKARFTRFHDAGFTLTSSSLAGRQFYPGSNYPIFTIRAVHSTTELELDMAWGSTALAAASYTIYRAYYSIDPDLKTVLHAWDSQVGREIKCQMPFQAAQQRDPQRTASGDPQWLVDHAPSEAGSMQVEVWPKQTAARQLPVMYVKQWPKLKQAGDRPPHFINPSIFVDGAIADALRIKNIRNMADPDPFFNPDLANTFEQKFRIGLDQAANADEAKAQRAFQFNYAAMTGYGGANFLQSHDADLERWMF